MNSSHNDKFYICLSKTLEEDGTFYIYNDSSQKSFISFKIRDKQTHSLYISMNFGSFRLQTIYKTSTRDIQNYIDRFDETSESKEYLIGYKKLQLLITITIDEFMRRHLLTEKACGHERHIK